MKRIITAAILCITLLLLTGCMRQEISIKINTNDSSTVTSTLAINKSIFEEYFSEDGEMLLGDNTQEWYEYEEDGETYLAVTQTADFETLADLEKYLRDMEYPNDTEDAAQKIFSSVRLEKNKNALRSDYLLVLVTAPIETTAEDEAMIELPSVGNPFKLVLNFEFPGEMLLNDEPVEKTARIVITDFEESQTITAVGRDSRVGSVLIGAGSCVLVIALVILLYIRKTRNEELKQQKLFGNDRDNF